MYHGNDSTKDAGHFLMVGGSDMSLHNKYGTCGLWFGANTVRNSNEPNTTNKRIDNANSTAQQRTRKTSGLTAPTQYAECTWHRVQDSKRTEEVTRVGRHFALTLTAVEANTKRIGTTSDHWPHAWCRTLVVFTRVSSRTQMRTYIIFSRLSTVTNS